jgi:DNA gyrase/topoisomerase IV subunit A
MNEADISIEDLIEDEEVVITISHAGYIKRTPASANTARRAAAAAAHRAFAPATKILWNTCLPPPTTTAAALYGKRPLFLAESVRNSGRRQSHRRPRDPEPAEHPERR